MKLRSLLIGAVLVLCSSFQAFSQQSVGIYQQGALAGGGYGWIPVGSGNPLNITGTFSSTTTGFAPASVGTPISVSSVSATGTLPAGTVVVAANAGTANSAFCQLGASSTTSSQLIPPNSWFAFTVGAATQLSCITSSGTTTVNMIGGSGLPSGAGGGSSGASVGATGSAVPASATYFGVNVGGNLTGLSGASLAAGTAPTNGLAILCQFNSSAPAPTNTQSVGCQSDSAGNVKVNGLGLAQGSATSGQTGSMVLGAATTTAPSYTTGQTDPLSLDLNGNLRVTQLSAPDPCVSQLKSSATFAITSATTTSLVAAIASKKIYICSIVMVTGIANNANFYDVAAAGLCSAAATDAVFGANSNAATNGFNFAANGGLSLGNGGGTVGFTPTANSTFCVVTSAAGPLSGSLTFVQQ